MHRNKNQRYHQLGVKMKKYLYVDKSHGKQRHTWFHDFLQYICILKTKQLTLRCGYAFLFILTYDWISLLARFPSSAVLSLLGPPQEVVSLQTHSCSVSCGCSSRDISVLIQEFLKSLMVWVPEAFLHMSSLPMFALQWFHSTDSQCFSLSRSHSNSPGSSCCRPPGSLTYFHTPLPSIIF